MHLDTVDDTLYLIYNSQLIGKIISHNWNNKKSIEYLLISLFHHGSFDIQLYTYIFTIRYCLFCSFRMKLFVFYLKKKEVKNNESMKMLCCCADTVEPIATLNEDCRFFCWSCVVYWNHKLRYFSHIRFHFVLYWSISNVYDKWRKC